MSVRDSHVPEAFIKMLRRGVKGFSHLTSVHQQRMARHIWLHGLWYKQHKHPKWGEYMTITWQELEQDFGRSGFNAINESLHLFDVTPNWHSDKHLTKGYKPTAHVQDIKDRYLKPRKRQLTRLIDSQGRALRSLPNPVAAKTVNSNDNEVTATAWDNAKPLNKIPVDIATLTSLYTHLEHMKQAPTGDMFADAKQEDIRYLSEAVSQLLVMANTDVAGQGYIMHRYAESKSGRLYAKGVSLQTTPRTIRQAALHGLYEYDFENCHYAIFSQMAAKHGVEAKGIAHYLANKEAVRQQLMSALGITEDQAKTCLMAIMYGARTNAWHENAIPTEIGQQKAKALYAYPLFQAIHQDIKDGRRVILDNWPSRRSTLLNDIDKWIRKDEKPEKKLAHLLQGVEAKALRAIIRILPTEVLLLMHDGFVTSRPIDTKAMEQEVLKDTGYHLSLVGKVITLPADLHF